MQAHASTDPCDVPLQGAAANHAVQVTLDPLIINRDDIVQGTRCSLGHGGFLLLTWLRFATSSSARFGAASLIQLCETFHTSSDQLCEEHTFTCDLHGCH